MIADGVAHVFARGEHGSLLEFYGVGRPGGTIKDVINISADTGARIFLNPSGAIADGVVHAFARGDDWSLLEFYWGPGGFKHVINISADTGARILGDPSGAIADGVVHAFARER